MDRKVAMLSESMEDGSESEPLQSPPRHCEGGTPINEGIAQPSSFVVLHIEKVSVCVLNGER